MLFSCIPIDNNSTSFVCPLGDDASGCIKSHGHKDIFFTVRLTEAVPALAILGDTVPDALNLSTVQAAHCCKGSYGLVSYSIQVRLSKICLHYKQIINIKSNLL